MRIVRNTPEQLIVAERPWLLGIALILFILVFATFGVVALFSGNAAGLLALLGAGLGYAAFFAFVRRLQVIFDRASGTIEIRRSSLRGRSRVRHQLDEVAGAEVEAGSGGSDTSRIVLIVPKGQSAGRHALTEHYSNLGDHADVARTINAWLDAAR